MCQVFVLTDAVMLSCCQIRHEFRLISASAYRCQLVQKRSISRLSPNRSNLSECNPKIPMQRNPLSSQAKKIRSGAVAVKGDISLLSQPYRDVPAPETGFYTLL